MEFELISTPSHNGRSGMRVAAARAKSASDDLELIEVNLPADYATVDMSEEPAP